jgi:hypothetical protein
MINFVENGVLKYVSEVIVDDYASDFINLHFRARGFGEW